MLTYTSFHRHIKYRLTSIVVLKCIIIKLATWNLCLGLINKKMYVTEMMKLNRIDVCCLQEIDIKPSYNHEILSWKGYSL